MHTVQAAYIAGIIDGEGTITLTRLHSNEHRRPIITVASTDIELLEYLVEIMGGKINNKKNYSPENHKESYTLVVKNKNDVINILKEITPFLRINKKQLRSKYIIDNYDKVTIRNGRYNENTLNQKLEFEKKFFDI